MSKTSTRSQNENNINWVPNSFRSDIIKLAIISLIVGIILILSSFYTFLLAFYYEFNIGLSALFLVIGLLLLVTGFVSFWTYPEVPTLIGFSNEGLYCKFNKLPKSGENYPLEFVRWKDIKNIKQAVTYGRLGPIKFDLPDKELQSPFRAGLVFECKTGMKYELYDVSKSIMKKIIEHSKILKNGYIKVPIDEEELKLRFYSFFGYTQEGKKDYSNYLALLIIPFFIFIFWRLIDFAVYLIILILIVIIPLSIILIFHNREFKKELLAKILAYEKKSGKKIIPEDFRNKVIKFKKNNSDEIQRQISNIEVKNEKAYLIKFS